MVFKRKRNGKKNGFLSKAKTVGQVAHKALSTALMVKNLLNVEYKHIDTAVTTSVVSSTGTVLPMCACAEGASSNERNGLSIRVKSLFMRGYAVEHASATDTLLRVCIIRAINPNGTTPTISDLFESSTPYLSLQNNINTKEYKILYSKFITLSSNGTSNHFVEVFKELNHITKYNASTGTAANIDWNGYYLVLVSNQATNTPTFYHTARIRFIDN